MSLSAVLLQRGTKITPDMAESVKRIGEEFEFCRENFPQDKLAETDAGLQTLYSLFSVAPIAKRRIHDGVSPIVVEGGSWEKQYEALWDLLVPSSGAAKTMQSEAIRIVGRVRDELYRNGGANWDRNYRKMLYALPRYFASGAPLSEAELEEAKKRTAEIRADGGDEDLALDCLCELSVLWGLSNPAPIPLGEPDYAR